MATSLQFLFSAINQAQDEQDLRSQVVPKIGEYFVVKRWGVFFFDQLPFADNNIKKALQIGLSIEYNPVVRYVVERHAPIHEALVVSPKIWTMICPRPDHRHVMAGPIVSHGQLVGAVGCTREQSMLAFDSQNLADLSAICLHLSTWAATMRSHTVFPLAKPTQKLLKSDRLTSRELEIAELVALGRTNAEIGKELWIAENSVKQALKRMFRKLEVSSRAEMVAQLYGEMLS
ncbi:MAG: LuxR family transcriptional regulator [Cyanomargarita calcarea GSE-NOS-MK-12-04C]|jgi:DNA-binding CsgD family transcriptional regulator|uniref:LuxR family transcriptional regulator n=1 Tax=Cyanomargarita calcarea GSE-NOS-MK-12-04C TaxID=2839659 RepID=A0A951QKD4_9CYAN|nr:LuxR family transcriptional regulator [Cyanomargarita calcarea GSE-NOS-MK-12-04C]